MRLRVLLVCMYRLLSLVPREASEGTGSLGPGDTDSWELPRGCLQPKLGLLQEPSLQPLSILLFEARPHWIWSSLCQTDCEPTPTLPWVLGIQILVLMLVKQAFYPLDLLSNPSSCSPAVRSIEPAYWESINNDGTLKRLSSAWYHTLSSISSHLWGVNKQTGGNRAGAWRTGRGWKQGKAWRISRKTAARKQNGNVCICTEKCNTSGWKYPAKCICRETLISQMAGEIGKRLRKLWEKKDEKRDNRGYSDRD